ncbi:glycosyltransferase family 4 protein [Rhizobiales bacterium]|uniref:glycosyltransferase family 4 protein n=1 Tax=Hongsoonwoonella zoysiae TaxID=2821844 RepID=UPI00155FBBA3|nr:glycosyltransferase family 4 protein [Hongsoonwoonella zoysiae]NRG16338.1 glycosyltransferase family 4 protein [Hongsoonwoonella zoysiae]
MSETIHFLYPGDIDTPTGGYAYDRRLISAMREEGVLVQAASLGEGYPAPSNAALERAAAAFAKMADGSTVIVDGLAFGVLDEIAHAHRNRLRLIALVHHPLALETGLDARRSEVLRRSETRALSLAHAVIATSRATADMLVAEFGVQKEKITVAEPGFDRAEPSRGRNDGKVGLIAVGSVVPRKDYATLVAALARLTDLPWHLDIAGDDTRDTEYAASIRQMVEANGLPSRITLHGALSAEALDELYASADIFALTTRYEGYGMAFAEAMMRGLPVVATGEGAVRDTVPESVGFVLAGGDAEGVSRALSKLIADAGLRATLRMAAMKHAKSLPAWRDTAQSVITGIKETQ